MRTRFHTSILIIGLIILVAIIWAAFQVVEKEREEVVKEEGMVVEEGPADAKALAGEGEVIKIGVILPLSGLGADIGNWMLQGLILGAEEINRESRDEFELIVEDSQCDPKVGISALNKLTEIDQVDFIVGPAYSPVAAVVAPLVESKDVLMITLATAPVITEYRDIFRMAASANIVTNRLTDFMIDEFDTNRVTVLYINNEFGKGVKDFFVKNFHKKGGDIDLVEPYSEDEKDFRAQLLKIKDVDTPAIFVIGFQPNIHAQIFKELRELGIESEIFAYNTVENEELIKLAGDVVEGLIYSHDDISQGVVAAKFREMYLARYTRLPEQFAAQSYDTINMIKKALDSCPDRSVICAKEHMHNIKNFEGAVSDSLSVDENGDIERGVLIKTVRNGKFVPYEEEEEVHE